MVASAKDLKYNVVRNSSPSLILMSDSDEDRRDEVISKVDCKGMPMNWTSCSLNCLLPMSTILIFCDRHPLSNFDG